MDKVKAGIHKVEDKLTGHKSDDDDKGTILVTGASSFVGTHVIKAFLRAGYRVRGQVRNAASAAKVRRAFPTPGGDGDDEGNNNNNDRLTTVEVPDITAPGAFDAAVAGVSGVVHCASPFVLHDVADAERDLLAPAVRGTTRVLESAASRAPRVRRVVVTSSFAAIVDPAQGLRPGYVYTEDDWNPTTREEAVAATGAGSGAVAYCASKAFAERAAGEFVARERPGFTVATVCPPMVYGPVEHDVGGGDLRGKLNTSIADIYRLMDGSSSEPGPTGFPAFADVRDVAEAHLRAYEREEAGRYLVTSGSFEYRDVCRILREVLGPLGRAEGGKVPDPEATPAAEFYAVDNSRTARELGMTFRSLRESIRDTALSLVALEEGRTWREVEGAK